MRDGEALIARYQAGENLSVAQLRTAVRYSLEEFAQRYPGHAVEIRIPWIGAVQAIEGVNHRRGTPPNVVEMDGETWLALVTGAEPAPSPEKISYSGPRADLRAYLPLWK